MNFGRFIKYSGILICILSIVFGLYMGFGVCFVGGIMQIINGFQIDPMSAGNIAIGFLKIILTSVVGWFSFGVGFVFGTGIIALGELKMTKKDEEKRIKKHNEKHNEMMKERAAKIKENEGKD